VKLDKTTGEVVWTASLPDKPGPSGKDGAAYSSIVVSEGAGVRHYVQLVGRGVVGVRADDGRLLWIYNRIANGTASIPTPLVKDDFVFCSSGYGTGAALLKLVADGDGVRAEEQYFLEGRKMQNHHGGMVLLGDYVYCGHGHNDGQPLCIHFQTGKDAWRPGRGPGSGSAAVTYADGHFYFRYQSGDMALIEATPDKYKLKGTFKIASRIAESWPHPVIAGGRLYLRDQDVLLCYDVRKK
jgi:outer membrane protein assembly factor BamB